MIMLFIASVHYWTGPVHKKRRLLEVMWEGCGFRAWMKILPMGGAPLISLLLMVFLLPVSEWEAIGKYIVAAFGLFPFLPSGVNVALSLAIYTEAIGCVVTLTPGLKRIFDRRVLSPSLFVIWTGTCLIFSASVFLLWWLSSVDWKAVWEFIVSAWKFIVVTLGLFPALPRIVNVALSIAIYAEIIGCMLVFVSGLKNRHKGRRQSLRRLKPWTIVCLSLSITVLLIWGLTLVNWRAVGRFIAGIFGLLPSLPTAVNIALSAAIYVEIIGCVACLASGLKNRHVGWKRSLTRLWGLTIFCLGLVIVAFLGWGLYTISDQLSWILAITLTVAIVVLLFIIILNLIKDALPFFVVLRSPARYGSEMWKQELRNRDPEFQAWTLRRTTPDTLNLSMSDFLMVLQEIENSIQKEPALSAYWAKRYQVEQTLRQERIG
jgi:hypothetical protein